MQQNGAYLQMFSYARLFGFSKFTAQALARLARYIDTGRLSPAETKKWKEKGVMDEEGYLLFVDVLDPIEWVLLGLLWENYVMRESI